MPPQFTESGNIVQHPLEKLFNASGWDILSAIEKGFRVLRCRQRRGWAHVRRVVTRVTLVIEKRREPRRNRGEVRAQRLDLGDFGAFHRPAMYSVTRR